MTSEAIYNDAVTYVPTEKILIKMHYRDTGTGLANRDSSSTNLVQQYSESGSGCGQFLILVTSDVLQ